MVCFGPTVMSRRPPPASRKDMLCRTYIGMATIFCDPIWYDINRKLPSGGMKDRILSDCNHTQKIFRNLLSQWSRVLLEKTTGSQLVKKFPTYYGTWRFITVFTSACHLSLSSARSIQSMPPPTPIPLPEDPSSYYPPIYARVFQVVSFPHFPHQNPVCTSPLPSTYYMPHPSHSSQFDHPNNIWLGVQIIKLLMM